MSTATKRQPSPMTSDEFLIWALDQPGDYELVDGFPVQMQAERIRHAGVKGLVYRALGDAILRGNLPCEAWPDGVALRIDDTRTRKPDAVVTCGGTQDGDALALERAVIVVEVLSPSNSNTDKLEKLDDYQRVPGLVHYLIVHPIQRYVIHHRFGGEATQTRVVRDGDLRLEPPGLTVPVADLFPPEPVPSAP